MTICLLLLPCVPMLYRVGLPSCWRRLAVTERVPHGWVVIMPADQTNAPAAHLWGSARGASSSDFKAAAVRKEVGELGNALNGKPIGRRCWPAIAGVVAPPAAHVGCPARNRGKSSSPTTQANSFPPLQLGQGTFPSISMADECTSACFAQCHQRDARRRVAGGSAENPPDGGFIRPAGFVRRNVQEVPSL